MPNIGTTLTSPESGWTRFDQNSTGISWTGTGWIDLSYAGAYNSNSRYTDSLNDSVQFCFTGTKLRILSYTTNLGSNKVDVYIDGLLYGSINQYSASIVGQVLEFEVLNLASTIHSVKLVNAFTNASFKRFYFDCFDIDTGGTLASYSSVTTPQFVKNKIIDQANNTTDNTSVKWTSLRFSQPVTVSKIRILIYSCYNASLVNIKEVEMYLGTTKVSNNGASPAYTATATTYYGGGYEPTKTLDGTYSTNYGDNWFSSGTPQQTVMFTSKTTALQIDRIRYCSHDSYSFRGVLRSFEIQFSNDPTSVIGDSINSTKWFSVDLINGKTDGTEKAYDADSNGNACQLVYGAVGTGATYKYLLLDGTNYKYISAGNLVTACSTTDDNTTKENAFLNSGMNNLSSWTDSLKNQLSGNTFKVLMYKK